jgi:hypothetical protein
VRQERQLGKACLVRATEIDADFDVQSAPIFRSDAIFDLRVRNSSKSRCIDPFDAFLHALNGRDHPLLT